MNISEEKLENDITKVVLDGELDIAGSETADAYLNKLAAGGGKVIADLSKVAFIASAGIRVLVKTAKDLEASGGKLVALNPDESSRRVMWTTGLQHIVPIADSELEAITALS